MLTNQQAKSECHSVRPVLTISRVSMFESRQSISTDEVKMKGSLQQLSVDGYDISLYTQGLGFKSFYSGLGEYESHQHLPWQSWHHVSGCSLIYLMIFNAGECSLTGWSPANIVERFVTFSWKSKAIFLDPGYMFVNAYCTLVSVLSTY